MKLKILKHEVGTPEVFGPACYNAKKKYIHPVLSTPVNDQYPNFPVLSWVDQESIKYIIEKKIPYWYIFKQEKIL